MMFAFRIRGFSMVTALILVSALLNAAWNASVKSDGDRSVALAWIIGLGGGAGACALPFVDVPRPEVWPYLAATTILQNGYMVLLLLSYRHGDLSQAYPIARGTAALCAALVSSLLGIDALQPREWLGIAVSSLGIASLAFTARGAASRLRRAVAYPLLSGLFTAGYSLVDGSGVRVCGDPLQYVAWMSVCVSPFLPAWLAWRRWRSGAPSRTGPDSMGRHLAAAAVALISYGIAVWAFSQNSIGRTVVLRETSVLFAAIFGAVLLKEPFGARRILSALVILLGFSLWP